MRLYLHIGMNKTGTTAVQRYLATNEHALAAAGYVYPQAGRQGQAHYRLSRTLGFDHGVAMASLADRQQLAETLRSELAASGRRAAVLSSEFFVLPRDVGPVRDFFAGYDVRIVVYLRRHDHWWESSYNQAVKTVTRPPWAPGIEAYIEWHRQRDPNMGNYVALLDRWADAFGREKLLVRPYEAEQNDGGILPDFLRTAGMSADATSLSAAQDRLNESPPPRTIELLDIVQRAEISQEMRKMLISKVLATSNPPSADSLLSPARRRAMLDAHGGEYASIARTYLDRPDGVLFREPLPSPEDAWRPPQRITTVDAVSILLKYLTTQSHPD